MSYGKTIPNEDQPNDSKYVYLYIVHNSLLRKSLNKHLDEKAEAIDYGHSFVTRSISGYTFIDSPPMHWTKGHWDDWMRKGVWRALWRGRPKENFGMDVSEYASHWLETQ